MDGRPLVCSHHIYILACENTDRTLLDNKQGVTYQKKYIPGDSSAIPIVRGLGLVEGFTPQQFLALITYTGVRTTWDARTEKAEVVRRFGRFLNEFYAIQR